MELSAARPRPLPLESPPPLPLPGHFMAKDATGHATLLNGLITPVFDMPLRYHWPGKVRELEDISNRAVIILESPAIHGRLHPPTLQTPEATEARAGTGVLAPACRGRPWYSGRRNSRARRRGGDPPH